MSTAHEALEATMRERDRVDLAEAEASLVDLAKPISHRQALAIAAALKDLRAAAESAANVTKTLTEERDHHANTSALKSQRAAVHIATMAKLDAEISRLTEERDAAREQLAAVSLSLHQATEDAAELAKPDPAIKESARVIRAQAERLRQARAETVRDQAAEAFDTLKAAYEELKAERDRLRALMPEAREYVCNAATRFYDGTQGDAQRRTAVGLLGRIDAALSATKGHAGNHLSAGDEFAKRETPE